MGTLRIRPWPFKKNEDVELYWIGSVFQSSSQLWYVRCIFKRQNGEMKEIDLPWATLPGLILGKHYINGIINIDFKKEKLMEIQIPKDIEFENCTCKEIPRTIYNFTKIKNYKSDYICRFKLNNCTYFIPCTEIIRGILAPYQVLANKILKPNGIDDFFELEVDQGKVFKACLSLEYPKNLLKGHIVGYFVWLIQNSKAYSEWTSVYKNLLLSAAEITPVFPAMAFAWGVPLKAVPPISVDCTWKFYGKKHKDYCFIKQLVYQDGVDPRYEHIKYIHPTQQKTDQISIPRGQKNSNNGRSQRNNQTTLSKNQLPSSRKKKVSNVEQPTVSFRFHDLIICEKVRLGLRKSYRNNKKGANPELRNSSNKGVQIATTQDWNLEGKLNAIEFNTLELVNENPQRGLERFFKVISYIKKYFDKLDFEIGVAYVPSNKAFSLNDNGSKRTCAFVKVYKEKVLQCYILEFSRSDEWPISTLYIWPLSPAYNDKDFEDAAMVMLNCAIDNAGHWDNESLSSQLEFRFEMTKHVPEQSIERWAEIIVEKLLNNSI